MNFERQRSVLGLSVIVVAALIGSACVDHVDTGLKPCPCADGYVCCQSGVCAADSPSCDVATGALSASVQGSWSGYIENFRAGAPDAIQIKIAVAADGALSGEVTFGAGAPPPPPTDPALPWPPGYDTTNDPSFLAGASYTARDINWQSRRLKLQLGMSEPWQPWCALLPAASQDTDPPSYACEPPGTGYADERVCRVPGETETIDCDKLAICLLLCQCDASGCHATNLSAFTVPLDIAFDGAKAEGSISVYYRNYNLRLTRDP